MPRSRALYRAVFLRPAGARDQGFGRGMRGRVLRQEIRHLGRASMVHVDCVGVLLRRRGVVDLRRYLLQLLCVLFGEVTQDVRQLCVLPQ